MKTLILALSCLVLAACDHWNRSCEDLAEWSIPISRGTSKEGADANATRAPDGSLFAAFTDDDVTFGSMRVSGPHVAHVSEDGDILAVADASGGGMYPGVMLATADRLYVNWGLNPGTLQAYDYELHLLWSVPLGMSYKMPLDVAATGEIVTVKSTQGPSMTDTAILYLNRDGTTRWSVSCGTCSLGSIRFADNTDVIAYVYDTSTLLRRRLAAADGAVLEEVMVPPTGSAFGNAFLPDGGSLVLNYDHEYIVQRFDANGVELWSHRYDALALNNPVLSTTGDILLQALHEDLHGSQYSVLVLNGATGAERATIQSCGYITVLAADGQAYYGLGLTGSDSVGLARFSMTP